MPWVLRVAMRGAAKRRSVPSPLDQEVDALGRRRRGRPSPGRPGRRARGGVGPAPRRRSRVSAAGSPSRRRGLRQVRGDEVGERQQARAQGRRPRRRRSAGRRWSRPSRDRARSGSRPRAARGRRPPPRWSRPATASRSSPPRRRGPRTRCRSAPPRSPAGTSWMAWTPRRVLRGQRRDARWRRRRRSAEKVFRSAWMPAPPLESEPAMVTAMGVMASGPGVHRFASLRRDAARGEGGIDPEAQVAGAALAPTRRRTAT